MSYEVIEAILETLGNDKLRQQLLGLYEDNKFKDCPASCAYHHWWRGGYWEHVKQVMVAAQFIWKFFVNVGYKVNFSYDDLILCSFAHDLNKLDAYQVSKESPTDKQIPYAISLGIKIEPDETKLSLSYKIDRKLSEKTGKAVARGPFIFERVEGSEDFEESGKVATILGKYDIVLSDAHLKALSLHHGGWADISRAGKKVQMSELAVVLHSADILSGLILGVNEWSLK